jgi:hypothetical protein
MADKFGLDYYGCNGEYASPLRQAGLEGGRQGSEDQNC